MTDTLFESVLESLTDISHSQSVVWTEGYKRISNPLSLIVKDRTISLPINPEDLDWLCDQGQKSHFGKNTETSSSA